MSMITTKDGTQIYLGAELAKAETALRLDLRYEQDQVLRNRNGQ